MGWACSITGQTITCTLQTAVASNTFFPPLTIRAMPMGPGAYKNCASLLPVTGSDIKPLNNQACVTVVKP